jgi:hypothetical protein
VQAIIKNLPPKKSPDSDLMTGFPTGLRYVHNMARTFCREIVVLQTQEEISACGLLYRRLCYHTPLSNYARNKLVWMFGNVAVT